MSHKVHPYAHRLGVVRDWQSRWFGRRGQFQNFLKVDVLLRQRLEKILRGFYVTAIEIERGQNSLRTIIKTSRPGMVIGRSGEGTTKIKNEIVKFITDLGAPLPPDLRLDIEEVKNPESHARIAAWMLIEGLERRLSTKRVAKQVLDKIMANRNVEGARITLSGRLNGTEIGRTETVKAGRLPLQTIRADIDFAREQAHLPYGVVGVKVWIYRGNV